MGIHHFFFHLNVGRVPRWPKSLSSLISGKSDTKESSESMMFFVDLIVSVQLFHSTLEGSGAAGFDEVDVDVDDRDRSRANMEDVGSNDDKDDDGFVFDLFFVGFIFFFGTTFFGGGFVAFFNVGFDTGFVFFGLVFLVLLP